MMSTVSRAIQLFAKQETGLETVEYAVITAMLVSTLVVALGFLILAISDIYEGVIELL